MTTSVAEESEELPTETVTQRLFEKIKPHALIDCQGIKEYYAGLKRALDEARHNYVAISTADLHTLDESKVIATRNTPPPKYVLVESLEEARSQLRHFHSQDSLGSLRLCKIREFAESLYFGDRSGESYDGVGNAELGDLLVRQGFPAEETQPFHRLFFETRRSNPEMDWFDEVYLIRITDVEKAWRELGAILKISFTDMPNFSVVVGDPQLFQKFQADVRLFLERPNILVRDLKLNTILEKKDLYLKVDEPRTERDQFIYFFILNERSKKRLKFKLEFAQAFLQSARAQFATFVAQTLSLTCAICLTKFNTVDELRHHISGAATAGNVLHKEYICSRCGHVSISHEERYEHQTTHQGPQIPESPIGTPPYQATRYEPPSVGVAERYKVSIRPQLNASLLELNLDTFLLPNEFSINQITYAGKRIRCEPELRFKNSQIEDAICSGKYLQNEVLRALIFDPENRNFIVSTVPTSQYLDSSSNSRERLLECRKNALEEATPDTIRSYWEAFCETLKDLGESAAYESLEKVLWIDVYEVKPQTLARRCTLDVDTANHKITWVFEELGKVVFRITETQKTEDKVTLNTEFVERTFAVEGKETDVYLMPRFHPTKFYAYAVRNLQILYEIPVTIAKKDRYYYNYRRGAPVAIFIKSLVEIADRSGVQEYMNSVNTAEVLVRSLFGGETHTEHIAERAFELIKAKYIDRLNKLPYGRLRILDLGTGDGSLVHSFIYKHLYQAHETLAPRKIEVHLNDIAPQNLGIALIKEYERARGRQSLMTEKVLLRTRAKDYRDEIYALSKELGSRYFDITFMSRLLNMYTSIEMITTENTSSQLNNTPDSEGRYIQSDFNYFYATCKQLKEGDAHPWDSVSLGKYWVPRRVSAPSIRKGGLNEVLKLTSTISKSVIVVDLCVDQRLLLESLQDMESEVYFRDSVGATHICQQQLNPKRCGQFFYTYIVFK